MKIIIALFAASTLFFAFSETFAVCEGGTRSSSIGLTLLSNGCYADSSGREYSISSSSSSNGGGASSSSNGGGLSTSPNTSDTTNIFGDKISNACLRDGSCISMDTIPLAIVGVIEFLLAIAGTISVFALIYHAVKMQLASGITGDSSGVDKAKAGMKGSMIGFVISILAWFLVTRLVEILGAIGN